MVGRGPVSSDRRDWIAAGDRLGGSAVPWPAAGGCADGGVSDGIKFAAKHCGARGVRVWMRGRRTNAR